MYFVFTVLVFGLSSAPFVFTKVLKVLIKHWRPCRICIFAFIDDGFGGRNCLEEATRCSNIVQSDLAKSGFIAHPTKSQWIPKQEGQQVLQKKIRETCTGGKTHSQNAGQFSGYNNFHGLSFRPSC